MQSSRRSRRRPSRTNHSKRKGCIMISAYLMKRSVLAWTTTRRVLRASPFVSQFSQHASRRCFSALSPLLEEEEWSDQIESLNRYEETVSSRGRPVEFDADCDADSSSMFRVTAEFPPAGDQPAAIEQLVERIVDKGDRFTVLRGQTGTGKTLVIAHTIARTGRPTLVLCHNKTLAAQLARELRSFLRDNAVELFVSYYNHYRPEFFSETTGTYMAKKSSINHDLDALRHRATRALLTRRDVVVVASVSCIYGLGLPKEYLDASTELCVSHDEKHLVSWEDFCQRLEGMLYEFNGNNDQEFDRGQYQLVELQENGQDVKIVTLWPPHCSFPMQIDMRQVSSDNDVKLFAVFDIREGSAQGFTSVSQVRLFPARHHVVSEERLEDACLGIEDELRDRVQQLMAEGKKAEAERLQARVVNDLYLLRETGFCKGLENYSRHFTGRQPGEAPDTLLDYFKLHRDWMLMVDESHVTLPQLRSMYAGDQARKRQLVKHGYRLPSALDNRPLKHDEFWERVGQTVFVSATPSSLEIDWAERQPVDMMIRPTYVCDPIIEVRPTKGQLEDLLAEIKLRTAKKERTLAIALTKRDSEDLSAFLNEHGVQSTYIHSGLSTPERSDALRSLQSGEIDCLVGVNCLREGLDLPQVSLVAVLNSDSEGFLRSDTALLQVTGRAARHVNGRAIFYADRVTESMRRCMESTAKRREKQLEFNKRYGCEMRSTKGSSTMSFFDLLRDQIDAEQSLEVVNPRKKDRNASLQLSPITVELPTNALDTAVETDHIPSSPGVYFWKDTNGNILYIGKAVKLRGRVKSYLSPHAKHGARIQSMLQRACSVDVMLTPSERDALVLESNLIKHHQPPFNVLLKDDEHYPYICASVGDAIPRLSIVPKRQESPASSRHRYFGPYTSFKEINRVLNAVEEQYDLRAQSFLARHGSFPKAEYKNLFEKMLKEVFGRKVEGKGGVELSRMRRKYEEAGMLFDSKYNRCRDVVTVSPVSGSRTEAVVSVLQLRDGLVAGHFTYSCEIPFCLNSDQEYASAAYTVLADRHYPSGEESPNGAFSWFPDDILVSHPPENAKSLRDVVRQYRTKVEPSRKGSVSIRPACASGPRKEVDSRVLDFAFKNAEQQERGRSIEISPGLPGSVLDGSAALELAQLLALDDPPSLIECYDISHTQGNFPVGSRVVFVNGRPASHLYRKFNIKSVQGVDDYAGFEEVLQRRFQRAWVNGRGPVEPTDPWALPDLVVIDGGRGQLNAAIKGMRRACIMPAGSDDTTETIKNTSDSGRIASVAVCALAKDQEQVFVHGQEKPVNEHRDSPAVLLLRALRDESHRFALKAHRQRRSITRGSAG